MLRPRVLLPLLATLGAVVGAAPAQADVTGFTLTPATPQAASHQDVTFGVDLSGTNQSVRVDLPPGLLGNAASVPRCAEDAFQAGTCAADTQVGTSTSQATASVLGVPVPVPASGTISNLAPQAGEAARLGVTLTPNPNLTGAIRVEVPVTLQSDFSLRSTIPLPQTAGGLPVTVSSLSTTLSGTAGNGAPFATLPPTCSALTGSAAASADGSTYGPATTATITPQNCAAVPFTPTVAFATSNPAAGGSTGVSVTLTQPAGDAMQAQSPISSSTVTLPTGLGLDFAKLAGLLSKACPSLDAAVAGSCEGARMGSVAVDTPAAGTLTGSAYFTAAAPGADGKPTTGIFLVARDRAAPDTAVTLRLSATTTPTAPVVTVLDGLPPTLATRFQLSFDPLFTNPCTPTAQGSAKLTSASGATATPTASITTTGACPTTTTTATTPAATTPATTATTPPATTQTTPATTTTTAPTTTSAVPLPAPPAPTTTSTTGTAPVPATAATKLRVSLQRLTGRRVRVRTLVLAGSARCDGSVRVTINRGVRSTRLARRTVELPASCLVRTTFRLPRRAAGRRVSAQVALRSASELQDATVRTRTTKIRRG